MSCPDCKFNTNNLSAFQIEVNDLVCAGKRIHEVLIDAENAGIKNIARKYGQECQLMSDLRHPYITLFQGVCFLSNCQLRVLVLLVERIDSSLDDPLETVRNIPLALNRSILEDVYPGAFSIPTQTHTSDNPQGSDSKECATDILFYGQNR